MAIELKIDASEVERWRSTLQQVTASMARRVIPRAINHVGQMARTKTYRALAEQTGLPYGDMKEFVRSWAASHSHPAFELIAKGGYLTLARFHPHQRAEGVEARPWGIKRVFPHTWMIRSGDAPAYLRTSRARYPIRPVWGPDVPLEMLKDNAVRAFTDTAIWNLPARIQHEIDYLILQAGNKATVI